MTQSAREVLRLAGETAVSWAIFDPAWYSETYGEARGDEPEAALRFYLDRGQSLGHAPNRFFDERWYLRRYPAVAARMRQGDFESGFDHYCREGFASHSPHWLYSEALYREQALDLTDDLLESSQLANRYDHYLQHGSREGRIAHHLFDPAYYLARLADESARLAAMAGPFADYLGRLSARRPEVATSVYFDPAWYRARYAEALAAASETTWLGALHHYLCNDRPEAFDPLPLFSETWYRQRYQDIDAAVRIGERRTGYDHFLSHGALELRSPRASIDLTYYVTANPSVQRDIASGRARDGFAHLLAIGRPNGLEAAPEAAHSLNESRAKASFRARACNLLPLYGRDPLRFTVTDRPALSVVMVMHDNLALTLMALASLRDNFPGPIELVLADSGSSDETRQIERYVVGAKLLRFEANIGYLRACNAALPIVSADAVLYLNNDVELAHGAVAAALRRLDSEPSVGAVGGKIIRTHGLLQEAGGIIWRDGSTSGYMRDASPLAPEANFVRDTDYCSGVFLLVRTGLLRRLGGFDEAFAPAYYEDTDLCARIAQAGYRVVYDPGCVVHHLEYGSAAGANAAELQIARGQRTFAAKHFNYLLTRYRNNPVNEVLARTADSESPAMRVLFVEDRVPLRMMGSGFVRSNDLICTMVEIGCQVTVFPVLGGPDIAAVYANLPDTVEVMHDRTVDDLPAFLAAREGSYDVIWVARTHNLERLSPILERHARRTRVVLDTEAIVSLREAARSDLVGVAFDLDRALRQEFASIPRRQPMIAVNGDEAAILRDLGFPQVAVIGHVCEPRPTPRSWGQRAGLLLVGAFHQAGSPNHDSLIWLADEVLPLVERELGWETRLTVVGYLGDAVDLARLGDHPRITLRGPVADVAPIYEAHRVFVAPTRFAAGTPYKVTEAAAHGLPVAATGLLGRQLGWAEGEEILCAETSDPAHFAAQILRLYRDEALWNRVRSGALARLAAENGRARYKAALGTVLGRSTPIPFQACAGCG